MLCEKLEFCQRSRYLKRGRILTKVIWPLSPTHRIAIKLLKHRERAKMEMYALQEAKGAQTRARAKFNEEGEKNKIYLLNVEKAQSNVKIMDRIFFFKVTVK